MVHHIKSFAQSFMYAFTGVKHALKYNHNLRIHFVVGVLVAVASLYFDVNAFEMGILGVMIVLVICTEMINTSIEEMVDLITTEHRRQAEIAKDVAAGMVLVSSFGSVIVGILIFTPHILKLLGWHF